MARCRCEALSVYARFTRRGGIDINPFRTNAGTCRPAERAHATPMTPASRVTAIRGALVTFSGDPFVEGVGNDASS